MKSTEILLKTLDIELKELLSADIKKFKQQQANEAANLATIKSAA